MLVDDVPGGDGANWRYTLAARHDMRTSPRAISGLLLLCRHVKLKEKCTATQRQRLRQPMVRGSRCLRHLRLPAASIASPPTRGSASGAVRSLARCNWELWKVQITPKIRTHRVRDAKANHALATATVRGEVDEVLIPGLEELVYASRDGQSPVETPTPSSLQATKKLDEAGPTAR